MSSLRILAKLEELAGARQEVRRVAAEFGFCPADIDRMVLAADEALTNVIRHGYGGPCSECIEIEFRPCECEGRQGMLMRIRDYGQQVDPQSIQSRDLDDVRPGGLGVHIMRSIMDEVLYYPAEDRGMVLEMRKYKS